MIIYICGVHGVGKTYLCRELHSRYGIRFYTASELIKNTGDVQLLDSKIVLTQDKNEEYLTIAIGRIKSSNRQENFILDGHLCLFDALGKVSRLKLETILKISPDFLILLTEDVNVIVERIKKRDNYNQDINQIKALQIEEERYANEVSKQLNIPLYTSRGKKDIDSISTEIVKIINAA